MLLFQKKKSDLLAVLRFTLVSSIIYAGGGFRRSSALCLSPVNFGKNFLLPKGRTTVKSRLISLKEKNHGAMGAHCAS